MNRRLVVFMGAFGIAQAFAQTSPHGAIRMACEACHTTESWRMRPDASFSHASTGFDLQGAHKAVECARCHQGVRFAGTLKTCQSCHTDVHKGELGSNCARCHSFQAWRITDMTQRHQQTRFPLLAKHASADCAQCHTKSAGTQYAGTPTTCIGCH
ncbi:MAG: hypothetical protein HY046_08285, partial [Acidobacteria bacterium]|nr:hypothetical protein [Acidobacteriota bacterium]